MPNKRPADFTHNGVRLIQATLKQRSGHDIDVHLADTKIGRKRSARL